MKKVVLFVLGFIIVVIAILSMGCKKTDSIESITKNLNVVDISKGMDKINQKGNEREKIKEIAQKLEARGQLKLAREILLNHLKRDFSVDVFNFSFELNNIRHKKLSAKNLNKEAIIFLAPPKEGYIDSWRNGGWPKAIGRIAAANLTSGASELYYHNYKASAKQREIVSQMQIALMGKNQIQDIMEQYDVLRDSYNDQWKLLNEELQTNSTELDSILPLLKKMEQFKKQLKSDRTVFLSYNAISPYLFESGRLLFLADSDYLALKGKDKSALDEAVKTLAMACHKKWLYETNEDVRLQFIAIQTWLKQIANKVQLEDYKVFTTFYDTNDPSKPRGGDAWFK